MPLISLQTRIESFARLGKLLKHYLNLHEIGLSAAEQNALQKLDESIKQSMYQNSWFVELFIRSALSNIACILDEEQLSNWVAQYPELATTKQVKTVGVVMAGNIPMVGFHDMVSVLISGNRLLGKLSTDDQLLLPAFASLLIAIEPSFAASLTFTTAKISGFDAVIATGSNNTARYFEYYFGKYPHIIRRNRNGIAIINGQESEHDLHGLAEDVCTYFGLGCRSVSKLFLPDGFPPEKILPHFEPFHQLMNNHHKYFNNYEYNKAIMLINNEKHYDNGFLLLKHSSLTPSPLSVLHYEHYEDEGLLGKMLDSQKEQIQCIVSKNAYWPQSIAFGQSQKPGLADYADGVDTTAWLCSI